MDILRGALEEDPGNLRIVIPTVQSLAYLERNDEAMRVIAAAREANPDAPELKKLDVLVRPGLTPEERDAALLEVINDEPDAFKRALERAGFHRQRREYAETMANIDDAERHLIARDTPMARAASKLMHRSMLEQKLRAAVALGDTAAVKAVRDAARRHNVDGVVGKTILGISHLLLEEYEPAIVAFSEALEVQPSDARTWTNLGRCHDRSGRFADAVSCYGRAVEIDPNDVLAHRGLAQLALRRGETATFEHHLAECERLRSKDPWIQSQLTARKDHEDPLAAIARREKLLEDDPDDFDNIRQLAGLAERVRDFERADKYCDRLLEIRPDEQLLVNAIAKYHRRLGRPERSLELVRANIERRTTPEQRAAAHVFLASHYHGLGDIEQAEAALLAGVDVAETLDLTRELAVFYYRLKQPAKALHWFDKCVVLARDAKSPRLPQILAARIECLLQPGLDDVATARQRVEELLRDHPEEPVALTLNGEVYAREGHLDEAISSLTRFLRLRPHDTRVLYKRALLYLSLGDQPAAIADLEAIRQADPDVREVEARRQLARLYEQSGETDRAIAALEALRAAAPDSLAVFADYVQLLIRSERLADADRAVTTALNEAGNQALPSLHRLRGRVSLALGDTNKALEDYLRAAETGDFASTIMPHVLAMFIEAERYGDGAAFFEAHEQADQRTSIELARYGRMLAKTGRTSEAVSRFRSAVDLASRESREALLGARAELADAWTSADAIPLFESEVSDGGAARANERILAHLQLREGRVAKAVALIDGLIGSSQSDHDRAELWFEKGVLQLASDPPGARKSFEEAIRINPADWQAINNLAVVLSDNLGQHEQALRYAQEAVAKSGSPSTRDTLGWIQVKLGRFSDAVANLAHAIRLDPTSVEAHYHLGEAYRLSGRYVQSEEILRQGLKLAQDQDMADLKTRIESALAKSTRGDGAR
ncbi:MAG: tetratricopeptide repeat protein [Planctomycetes bacterium]|nr:tetratricopeptide repeat protein [Planctomycetota bacterium]